jgi:hypothetical protein
MAKRKSMKKRKKSTKTVEPKPETELVNATEPVEGELVGKNTALVAEPDEKDISFTDGPKLHEGELDMADLSAEQAKDFLSDNPEVTPKDPEPESEEEPEDVEGEEVADTAYAKEVWESLSEADRQSVLAEVQPDQPEAVVSPETPDEVEVDEKPAAEVSPAPELVDVEKALSDLKSEGFDEVVSALGPILTTLVERDVKRQKEVDVLRQSDDVTKETRRVATLQEKFDQVLDGFSDGAMPSLAQQKLVLKLTKDDKNPDYAAAFKEVLGAVTTPKAAPRARGKREAAAAVGGGTSASEPADPGIESLDSEGFKDALAKGDGLVSALVSD